MIALPRFTSSDLECLPDRDDVRYEIIDGELYVSKTPHRGHQYTCGEIYSPLQIWSRETGAGRAYFAPGLVFSSDNDVIPDVVWFSRARLPYAVDDHGHFHSAPDLVIEVLSPGWKNEQRDREFKLKLYSRQGVQEYWIIDWQLRTVQVYRRNQEALEHAMTLLGDDVLTSPVLPGFSCPLSLLWEPPVDA
jgi:Uma2 family endonuclease